MKFDSLPRARNKIALYCAVFILYFFFGIVFDFCDAALCFGAVHLCASAVLFVLGGKGRKYLRAFGIVALVSALGLLWSVAARYVYYYPSQRFISEYADSEHDMVLRIDRVDSYGDAYGNYDCSILYCDGKETENVFGVYPSVRLSSFGGDFAEKGDVVSLKGVISLPETETSGGFEEEKYLKSKHIFMVCDYNGGMSLVSVGETGILDRIRGRLSDNITRFVGDDAGDETDIAKCMLLGDKSGVRKSLKEMFRSAGISHVLSVSGLHLSILFMTISVILGLRKRTSRRRFVLAETVSCALVFLYMCFANFTPSIMRAGFMLIFMNLYSVLMFYGRRFFNKDEVNYDSDEGVPIEARSFIFDSVSSLFCAGVLIILISPYSIFDVGMQLSFMSTLGILIAVSVFGVFDDRHMNPFLRVVVTSLIITLSAVSFTLPICIYNFGTLSTVSFISNLIITPIMTPLLAILLVLALVSFLPWVTPVVGVCGFLGSICEALCGFCIKVAQFMGSFVFSVIDARESTVLVVVFVVYVALTVGFIFIGKKKLCSVGCLAIMCLYFIYGGISFVRFLNEFNNVYINYCTVGKRPYFCVVSGDDRVFFDDASGIASDYIIRRSLGEQPYDTDNVYVVVPRAYADLDSAAFNIKRLESTADVMTVLVPTRELCDVFGVSAEDFGEFARELSKDGFRVEYYGEDFSVCGIDFTVSSETFGTSFAFEDVSVVFGGTYDEEYASELSKEKSYCVYFCMNAAETDNLGYDSGAELYVSSHVHKNVRGANAIPTRRPEILKR